MDQSRKLLEADEELKPKEVYTYENLKEFKMKLDERDLELNNRENNIEEARKMVTKGVLDLEKRELEVESFRVEKELLLKEKRIIDEERTRLYHLCENLKVENENLMRQNREKDQRFKENIEAQIDPKTVKNLQRELEKARMLNETMKFKYNDYDRLMQDLLYFYFGENG